MDNNEKIEKFLEKAGRKIVEGDYEEAIKECDKALGVDTESAEAYSYRGSAKANLKRYDEAIADYDKAIEINPEDMWVYCDRGNAKADLKRYEEAIADYDKAIEIRPDYTNAYNNRGLAKVELGNMEKEVRISQKHYEEAIADYDEVVWLNPKFWDAYYNRGDAKANLKRYEEAIVDYDRAIEIDNNFAKAYNNRGNAKGNLKRYDEAFADYNRTIEIDPNVLEAYDNSVLLSFKKGDLIPKYLYIPFLNYIPFCRTLWVGVSFIMGLFLSLCGWRGEVLLGIDSMSIFFILTGFFLVAFEIGHRDTGFDEGDARATFEILIKSLGVCIAVFIIGNMHIIEVFDGGTSIVKNTLGLFYIILLYILINGMRSVFIDISTSLRK